VISLAESGTYEYHDKSTMHLGSGIDPKNPFTYYPPCFKFSTEPLERGTPGAIFRAKQIRNRRELLEVLKISASLSGHYGIYSGSLEGSLEQGYSFAEDSFVWAVFAIQDFGRDRALSQGPVSPEIADLFKKQDWSGLIQRCGKEIVLQQRKGVVAAAIFELHNVSEEQKKLVTFAAGASANAAVWGAEFKTSYENFVRAAAKVSSIRSSIYVLGGEGLKQFSGIVADVADIQAYTNALKAYLASYNSANAAVTWYSSSPISVLGVKGTNPIEAGVIDRSLADYYEWYQDSMIYRDRVDAILKQVNDKDIVLSGATRASLQASRDKVDVLMRQVLETAEKCRDDRKACKLTAEFRYERVRVPNIDPIKYTTDHSIGYLCLQDSKCSFSVELNLVGRFDLLKGSVKAVHIVSGAIGEAAIISEAPLSMSSPAFRKAAFIEAEIANLDLWKLRKYRFSFPGDYSARRDNSITVNYTSVLDRELQYYFPIIKQ
jgi:hypothetical protein